MNFNRFGNNLKQDFDKNGKRKSNVPISLEIVGKTFEGYGLAYLTKRLWKIDLGFRDYSRLFTHLETKKWKKLYDFVIMLCDKQEKDLSAIYDRNYEKGLKLSENFFMLNFPGYLEDGELYNQYAMCDVKGEPYEILFTEFQLNLNKTKYIANKRINEFLNDYCKREI